MFSFVVYFIFLVSKERCEFCVRKKKCGKSPLSTKNASSNGGFLNVKLVFGNVMHSKYRCHNCTSRHFFKIENYVFCRCVLFFWHLEIWKRLMVGC